jgi:hypothetical protein
MTELATDCDSLLLSWAASESNHLLVSGPE